MLANNWRAEARAGFGGGGGGVVDGDGGGRRQTVWLGQDDIKDVTGWCDQHE